MPFSSIFPPNGRAASSRCCARRSFAAETIYLRSASLNIVNTIVGLNFSCDGSHYLPYDEFLQKDNSFWFGVQS